MLERWAEEVGESILSRSFVESDWTRAARDERDRLVLEQDGRVVAYGLLRAGGDVVVRGRPDALLEALLARARERGDERLEAVVTTRDGPALAALERAGFERERDVWRVWLDLDEASGAPLPPGVVVRTYRDEDARAVHGFLELAFAENNESVLPFDEWLRFMTDHDDFDAAFWHLAEDGGELVACALTWKPFEGTGWLKDLAVHPAHRRRGLGAAMNAVAAAAYREAGVTRMGLKVDADNPTGAPRLYARLGYETDRVYAVLARRP